MNESELYSLFEKYGVENLRCIHRHRWPSHKSCFMQGKIKNLENLKQPTPLTKPDEKITSPWYRDAGIKIGYFDIETDNLFADFGTILSWCVKEREGGITSAVITKDELFSGYSDYRLVRDLIKELDSYDVIVGYNSTNFDLPYVRAKALHYDLPFLAYGELFHWDLYYTVKSKLRLSRKSLDNACDYLGIVGKTPIEKDVWRAAKYGEPKALEYVLEHNKGDVVILEELHNKLENSRKWIKKSI